LLIPAAVRRLARFLAVGIALAACGAVVAWACGPFFAAWMIDDESNLTASPVVVMRDELARLEPATPVPYKAKLAEQGKYRQTFEADQTELAAALTQAKVEPERRQELLRQVAELRAAIAPKPREDDYNAEPSWSGQPPLPTLPPGAKPGVPSGLPGEFDDYLRGAEAYHRGELDAARKAWTKLLGRPAAERRYRSTWAAYMLGRSYVDSDADSAAKYFERTRKLASDKLADSLGLAAASYGWQARAELKRGRLEPALDLYLAQSATGDPLAARSVRVVAGRMLADPKLAEKAVRTSRGRAVLAAYVVSRWENEGWDGTDGETAAKNLLAALQTAKVEKAEGADRLAWVAYRSGDFAAAEAWLGRGAGKTPAGEWIRAKLLVRAGKLAEAKNLLESVRGDLPLGLKDEDDLYDAYDVEAPVAARPRANGELGFLRLAQGQFQEALIALLHGGYWTDAAYVAERVLTLDELKTLADRRYTGEVAAKYKPANEGFQYLYAGLADFPDERAAYQLRYLLGRRLARSGRYPEAQEYLPAARREQLRDFTNSLANGRNPARPDDERARSLLRAACLARHRGMALFGTEVDPDWFAYGGSYDSGSVYQARAAKERHPHTQPTREETTRVRASAVEPDKRFHYRFRASLLGVEAASRFPDGSNDKAVTLAAAGTWIKALEPQSADPIYKLLIHCCAKTQVGKEAARIKWFPTVDACPADTRSSNGEDRN
jgi:hypothetical protein